MTARRLLPLTTLLLALAGVLLTGPARAQSFDETIHVNAEAGTDDGAGSAEQPLRTIQEAMARTQMHKKAGRSVRVVIAAGVYREAVEFAYSNYEGNGTGAAVVVEGAGPGETIIRGSDVFDGWQREGSGVFIHEWTHDWGLTEDPTDGYITQPEITLRREMVFVDGERMQQVLSQGQLRPGAFFVDEQADRLYLHPPTGTGALAQARVEVAVRPRGWYTMYENNFTLRGLTVEHVATPWVYGEGAVVISLSDHAAVEDVVVQQNNFMGFNFQYNADTQLAHSDALYNGHSGWSLFKLTDFRAERVELSYNNWRGALGDYTFWGPGNKSSHVHGMTVRGLRAIGNQSRGLWLDTDHTDTVFEDVELRDNLQDGLFIEAVQGPVTLRRFRSTANQKFGILNASSQNVTLESATLSDNQAGGLNISGADEGREMTDFETEETILVRSRDWTITKSVISQAPPGGRLISTTFGAEAWDLFVRTLSSNGNSWWNPARTDAFEWWTNERLTLEEWRARTDEDERSVFAEPGSDVGAAHHEIPLWPGWNLISSPVQPQSPQFEEVLAEVLPSVTLVKNGAGQVFIPDQSVNTIGTWRPRAAYMVHAKEADTLQIDGERLPSKTAISLQAGWNLIPYFGAVSMSVEEALSTLAPALKIVKDGAGQVYLPDDGVDAIERLQPGRGYKVYVSEEATLIYPAAPAE